MKLSLVLLSMTIFCGVGMSQRTLVGFSCTPSSCGVNIVGDGYSERVTVTGVCTTLPIPTQFFVVGSYAGVSVAGNCYSIVASNISGGVLGGASGVAATANAEAYDPFTGEPISGAFYYQYQSCYMVFPASIGGGNYPC